MSILPKTPKQQPLAVPKAKQNVKRTWLLLTSFLCILAIVLILGNISGIAKSQVTKLLAQTFTHSIKFDKITYVFPNKVRVTHPAFSFTPSTEPLISAEAINVTLAILPLFGKTIQLTEVLVEDPFVYYTPAMAPNMTNLFELKPQQTAPQQDSAWHFNIKKFELRNGTVILTDTMLSGISATLNTITCTGSLAEGPHITTKLTCFKGTVSVAQKIIPLNELRLAVYIAPDRVTIDTCILALGNGVTLNAQALFPYSDTVPFTSTVVVSMDSFPYALAPSNFPSIRTGSILIHAAANGLYAHPLITYTANIRSLIAQGTEVGNIVSSGELANGKFLAQSEVMNSFHTATLKLAGTLPNTSNTRGSYSLSGEIQAANIVRTLSQFDIKLSKQVVQAQADIQIKARGHIVTPMPVAGSCQVNLSHIVLEERTIPNVAIAAQFVKDSITAEVTSSGMLTATVQGIIRPQHIQLTTEIQIDSLRSVSSLFLDSAITGKAYISGSWDRKGTTDSASAFVALSHLRGFGTTLDTLHISARYLNNVATVIIDTTVYHNWKIFSALSYSLKDSHFTTTATLTSPLQEIASVQGYAILRNDRFDSLSLNITNVHTSLIDSFTSGTLPVQGILGATITGKGTYTNPSATLSAHINSFQLGNSSISRNLVLDAQIKDSLCTFSGSLVFDTLRQDGQLPDVTLSGALPLYPDSSLLLDPRFTLVTRFDSLPLTYVNSFQQAVLIENGVVSGRLSLRGNAQGVNMQGDATLKDATIVVPDISPALTGVSAHITFKNDEIYLKQLLAHLGKGTLSGSGSYSTLTNSYTTALSGKKLSFTYAEQAKLAIDTVLVTIAPSGKGTLLTAHILLGPSSYQYEQNIFSAAALSPQQSKSREHPINLNASIVIPDNFTTTITLGSYGINASSITALAGGALELRGPITKPGITGKISLVSGTATYMGNTFAISQGNAYFPGSQKIDPTIDILATTLVTQGKTSKLSDSIIVQLRIVGELSDPHIELTSQPVQLTGPEIVTLLTFGATSFSSETTNNEPLSVRAGRAAGQALSAYVSKSAAKYLQLENIEINNLALPGSGSDTLSVSATKKINNRVSISYSGTLGNFQTQKAILSLQLFPMLFLQTETDVTGNSGIGLIFKVQR